MNHIQRSERTLCAVQFLQYGLRASIISQETQLPLKFVRTLAKEQMITAAKSGLLDNLQSILSSQYKIMSSTLMLSIYHGLAKAYISFDMDLNLLLKAHQKHQQIWLGFGFEKELCISINQAWVLVTALLSQHVELSHYPCGYTKIILNSSKYQLECPVCEHLDSH